jgi:uncharacterized protein (TIGR01777 family)
MTVSPTQPLKIVMPGGSGQVGAVLARAFHADGHDVVVLSRRPSPRPWRVVSWDGATAGEWQSEIDGCDVLINLTGRSVYCRYTAANRQEILESRVLSTRIVGEAIGRAARPPRVWLQASTATIYSHRYDGPNDERCGTIGGDEGNAPPAWAFSIDVARAWEQTFDEAATPRTRKVAMRMAMTLSADSGGVFDMLLGLARHGLGGPAGDGRQYMSWIHADDFVAAVRWLIGHAELEGPVNIASPHPLPNAAFMRILRDACGARFGLPASGWMLEIGAMLMRTETELILKSRRVVPTRLIDSGFSFRYADWPSAARDLCRQWQSGHSRPHAA